MVVPVSDLKRCINLLSERPLIFVSVANGIDLGGEDLMASTTFKILLSICLVDPASKCLPDTSDLDNNTYMPSSVK